VVRSALPEPRTVEPTWSVAAAGGPAVVADWVLRRPRLPVASAWEVDVQRRPASGGLAYGGALEVSPWLPLGGAAALVTGEAHRGRWLGELSAGVGLQAVRAWTQIPSVTNSDVNGVTTTTTATTTLTLALYVRATAAVGFRCTSSVDLIGRLGSHVTTAGRDSDYISGTLGVRVRLP
jgi:hypothetical protein